MGALRIKKGYNVYINLQTSFLSLEVTIENDHHVHLVAGYYILFASGDGLASVVELRILSF